MVDEADLNLTQAEQAVVWSILARSQTAGPRWWLPAWKRRPPAAPTSPPANWGVDDEILPLGPAGTADEHTVGPEGPPLAISVVALVPLLLYGGLYLWAF